jgi:activator of HSP90 ATPase
MPASSISRRHFTAVASLLPAALGARATDGDDAPAGHQPPAESGGLSHAAAAIHQEISFAADSSRVYEALTNARQFEAVTRLSDAATLLTAPGAKPTAISTEVGGAFTLFGGYITGRHLELQPGRRLVQAWRAASWEPGAFSVVRFALEPAPQGCRLSFDHRGFPDSQGPSLAYGWRVHYWEPLAKLLWQD